VGDVPPAVVSHVRLGDGATRAVACGSGHTGPVATLGMTPDGAVLGLLAEGYVARRYARELEKAQQDLFGER